jgi:hypothetical protein
MATTASRENGSNGTLAKGGTWASGIGVPEQAVNANKGGISSQRSGLALVEPIGDILLPVSVGRHTNRSRPVAWAVACVGMGASRFRYRHKRPCCPPVEKSQYRAVIRRFIRNKPLLPR